MPRPTFRPIVERIAEGSIETNFLFFPPTIGPFERDRSFVAERTRKAYFKFVLYTNGAELGLVFLEDLWQGLRQVRAFGGTEAYENPVPEIGKVTPNAQILYAE